MQRGEAADGVDVDVERSRVVPVRTELWITSTARSRTSSTACRFAAWMLSIATQRAVVSW